VLVQVLRHRRSLALVLTPGLSRLGAEERPLGQELCYGTLRWQPRLAAVADSLLDRPLKDKDSDVYCLILLGLYQLIHTRIPDHAALAETVAAAHGLGKPWAKALVNAVLRRFQRERAAVLASVDGSEATACAHPDWLLRLLKAAWPEQWQAIVAANNARPPMTLRVNARRVSRAAYLEQLVEQGQQARAAPHTSHGLVLDVPLDVERLPGFAKGLASVQDAAAQLAAPLLDLAPGQRVLDACAAPGGKTGHILELQPALGELVALDADEQRLARVRENLVRLGLEAWLVRGDASAPAQWWDGAPFDRILLDAPCSATGVIRRHPDIKVLRHQQHITELAQSQRRMLGALWPLLRPGGMLLYATCSVLPQENEQLIGEFLGASRDARERPIEATWGHQVGVGRQILPGEDGMDGFYYACLHKL